MTKEKIIKDIEKTATTINTALIAEEVINWLAGSVENFIDNKATIFKMDLILDSTEGMLETQKLQNLYKLVPDDELEDTKANQKILKMCEECRRMLDKITAEALGDLKNSKDLLKKLFDRMIFYYEKVIPNPDSRDKAMELDKKLKELIESKETANEEEKKIIQDKIIAVIKEGESLVKYEKLEGFIDFLQFEYEAFSMGVEIKKGMQGEEKKTIKKYDIPEGFTCCFEIIYHVKQRPTVMF